MSAPFTGMLSMVAGDGSRLIMTAQPTDVVGPKFIDIVFTSNSGDATNMEDEVFPPLPILAR